MKIIDALGECVKRSDFNCCAADKPELYKIWNDLIWNYEKKCEDCSKLESIKAQIKKALEFKNQTEKKVKLTEEENTKK